MHDIDELSAYLARTTRLDPSEARRAVLELLDLLSSETPEAYVVRRHRELKSGSTLTNEVIFRQIVQEITGQVPGRVSTYEDMWKLTLVNYNAGSGCLSDAVKFTQLDGQDLTWENVSAHLPVSCQGAVDYVNDIAK